MCMAYCLQDFTPETSPKECRDAHAQVGKLTGEAGPHFHSLTALSNMYVTTNFLTLSQAVTWGSWTSFVSGSILSFLFSPIAGHLR